MFRIAKKPKKPRVASNRDDDEDLKDEEMPTVVRPVKKEKKRTIIRSFEVDESGNTEKRKKKRRGLGFGGSFLVQKTGSEEFEEANTAASETASEYNKAAIAKLKAEQCFRQMEEILTDDQNYHEKDLIVAEDVPQIDLLPSFIPLTHEGGERIILTGDDALHYNINNDDVSPNKLRESIKDAIQEDMPQDWEDEVTRRAGLHSRQRKSTSIETTNIDKLREEVQEALVHLQNQQEDLQQAFNRRQVEVIQTKEELDRAETEVKAAGTALEFYQELRLDLSSWVGALRDLKKKLVPLQEALRLVDKDFADRWVDLEDDAVNVLRDNGLLAQVLGRQPPIPQEAAAIVDEFGRDMKSQHIMAREKRARRRQQIQKERMINGDESDALIAQNDKDELVERRHALRKALKVAMDELDDHYTSIFDLVDLFLKWSTLYREDYKQCYAGMSLADLSSVLVQIDLCSTHHPLHWISDGFQWTKAFHHISTIEPKIEDSPLYRIIDRVLIPVVEDILHEQAYSLLSKQQSQSLSAFFAQLSTLLPKGNVLLAKLSSQLANYVDAYLRGIAIPLLKPGIQPSKSEDIHEAVTYAANGQLLRLEKILSNLLMCWAPVLGDKIAEPILNFMTSQFLFLLSSLQERRVSAEAFGHIWMMLQTTDWLGQPQFMLQAALLRGASTAYHFKV